MARSDEKTTRKDTDKRKRPTVVALRLLPAEEEAIERLMQQRQVSSRSDILRAALLRDLDDAGCLA